MGAERERERELTDLGFHFREVKSGVPRVFRVHFLLANLNQSRKGKQGPWNGLLCSHSGLSARGTSVARVAWPCVEVCRGPCVY